jgi:hypothetical protein
VLKICCHTTTTNQLNNITDQLYFLVMGNYVSISHMINVNQSVSNWNSINAEMIVISLLISWNFTPRATQIVCSDKSLYFSNEEVFNLSNIYSTSILYPLCFHIFNFIYPLYHIRHHISQAIYNILLLKQTKCEKFCAVMSIMISA